MSEGGRGAVGLGWPGPRSTEALLLARETGAPMGPPRAGSPRGVVYHAGQGSTVVDVDGHRFVDLAAGFGALLLGHGHPRILQALTAQAETLLHALGDLYPSDTRLLFEQRLQEVLGLPEHQVILGQSGSDALTAALMTALLATGRPGLITFSGAYHGLSYAPLACLGLRPSYRQPFAEQLNPHVTEVTYPSEPEGAARSLETVRARLAEGGSGAVLIEPILGRGGCILPPPGFLAELAQVTREAGALLIADEVWTGLGRAGELLVSRAEGVEPDILCLGKGLGGGLPLSACLAHRDVMRSWSRPAEVMHTATFAGNPLAAATGLALLEALTEGELIERSSALGARFLAELREVATRLPELVEVRGRGLMLALDYGPRPGRASTEMFRLLERGFITSTGGGAREVLILTPALTIGEAELFSFLEALTEDG